jgi:hypothetical protein
MAFVRATVRAVARATVRAVARATVRAVARATVRAVARATVRAVARAETFGFSSAELLATIAFLVVFRLLNRDFFWIVIVLAPRKPAFYFRCGFDAFVFSKGHAKLEQTITNPYSPLESTGCRRQGFLGGEREWSEFGGRLEIN